MNGNEWAKRQAAKAGIAFEPLDNGFASCEDPKRLQQICDRLDAAKIDRFVRKWLARLPHPFSAADRRAGYRYDISVLQAEFSLTQTLDRPFSGRVFFEEVIRGRRLRDRVLLLPAPHRSGHPDRPRGGDQRAALRHLWCSPRRSACCSTASCCGACRPRRSTRGSSGRSGCSSRSRNSRCGSWRPSPTTCSAPSCPSWRTSVPRGTAPGLGPFPPTVFRFGWIGLPTVHLDSDQLSVFAAAAIAAGVLWFIVRRTRVGLEMRATVDRESLASLRGINRAPDVRHRLGAHDAARGGRRDPDRPAVPAEPGLHHPRGLRLSLGRRPERPAVDSDRVRRRARARGGPGPRRGLREQLPPALPQQPERLPLRHPVPADAAAGVSRARAPSGRATSTRPPDGVARLAATPPVGRRSRSS